VVLVVVPLEEGLAEDASVFDGAEAVRETHAITWVRADRRDYSVGLPLPGGGTTTVDTPAASIGFWMAANVSAEGLKLPNR